MKKHILSSIVLLPLVIMLFAGCSAIVHTVGTGKIVDTHYIFKDFTGVELSGAVQYEVKQSDNYTVTVSTHEDLIEHLDIHQSESTLFVGFKPGLYSNADTMVMVTMPHLNKLAVSGACRGNAAGFDSNNDLAIIINGASKLNMDLKAGPAGLDISGASKVTGSLTSTDTEIQLSGASNLNMALKTGKAGIDVSGGSDVSGDLQALGTRITLSGASDCNFTGSAGNSVIEASGASEMTSPNLILQNADVNLTGASHAAIHTDGTLNVNLSGASGLDYSGNPTIGKIDISGASKINHK
jgi:hypothetical protein